MLPTDACCPGLALAHVGRIANLIMSHHPFVRVYVVDDDPIVRQSLEAALCGQGYDVVCVATAAEFFAQAQLYEEGCVLVDLTLPDMSGLALQQRLCEVGSTLAVVVIAGTADVRAAVKAMELGAVTVLEKPFDPRTLFPLVQQALERSHAYWARRQAQLEIEARLARLSDEERAVLDLMIAGLPIKAISLRLALSTRTVERRRKTILEKLQVRSLPELGVLLGRYWEMTGKNGLGRSR